MIWIRLIIIIMIGIGMIWVNLNYVQPYAMFGEGLDYCRALQEQGYFENKNDVADHKNCTVGLKEGPEECDWFQKKILNEEDQKECYNYDSYNDECEKNIDMKDYGMRCTHFSLGYFATAVTIMLWAFVVMIIFVTLLALWNGGKDEPTGDIYKK